MRKKDIFIILAFHAHEPLWDLPAELQKLVTDQRVNYAISPENYMRKRAKEGRNIYRDLIAMAMELDVPVTLDITNELLHQIRDVLPRTFEEMVRSYRNRLIHPLYTCAHHTHAAFLSPEEIVEELNWNRQFLHEYMNIPEPERKGFFFTEASVDSTLIPALEKEGIEYIVFPHLNPRKAQYATSSSRYNYVFNPFKVGRNMIALPRHFRVSQEIWRPITRWYPNEVMYQGYLMGQYFVFDNEYREQRFLSTPIGKAQAVKDYKGVLVGALRAAPSRGLILYIQDLELMDFGDVALEILSEAWARVKELKNFRLHFVTPDDYFDEIKPHQRRLPKVRFHRISWAPEIRLVSRSDGHYPPLEAGEFRGIDAVAEIFPHRPFIFWDMGKYLTGLFTRLIQAFGFKTTARLSAVLLSKERYVLGKLPYEKRIPLHLRLMKRACNWGWRPDEGRHKRPYLHGLLISDSILLLQKLYPENLPEPRITADWPHIEGLSRLLEVLVDTRVDYLNFGLARQHDERNFEPNEALRELDYVRDFREKAGRAAEIIRQMVEQKQHFDQPSIFWERFLIELTEHCRSTFLSLDHIQRAWGKGGDVDFLVEAMYKYLYDLYPPKCPEIMEQIEGSAEESEEIDASNAK